MCEQCLVNPLYFGEVLPGWYLIRARRDGDIMKVGDWGMIQCNDPTFVWETTPKMTAEQNEKLYILPEDFENSLYLNAYNGYELVKAAIEVGYNRDEDGYFPQWLYYKLSEFIRNTEPRIEEDSFPNRDDIVPHDYTLGKD